jgi:hypothetical protein
LRDVARPDGTRDVNYTGALADRFACMAHVGSPLAAGSSRR